MQFDCAAGEPRFIVIVSVHVFSLDAALEVWVGTDRDREDPRSAPAG